MKKYSNFVAFNGKNILVVFTVVVFFIAANSAINAANIIGYQSLVGLPHCKVSKCSCQRIGGDSLSYNILIFHSTMARTMKDYSSTNNSNANVTPNSAKTVSIEAFNIEMNAKNKAYYFILSHGLLNQFSDFCKNYYSSNPHKDCVDYLLSKI